MVRIIRFIFLCIQLITLFFMGTVILELITNNTMTSELLVRLLVMFGVCFAIWLIVTMLKRGLPKEYDFLD